MMNPNVISDDIQEFPLSRPLSSVSIYTRLRAVIIEVSAYVLAISASMILGMLSFSGALALWPARLIYGCFSFILSIAYEGEIYLQNIRGAMEKLSTSDLYEYQLTGLYLQEKLAKFDYNRNRILFAEPVEEDKQKVVQFNEILIIKRDEQFVMCFRNQAGEYEEQPLDTTLTDFLNTYQQEQFIENGVHNESILQLYKDLYGSHEIERTREQFPMLVKAYRTQLDYVEQWKSYLSTQSNSEEGQQQLQSMTEHLVSLEKTLTEQLFQRQEQTSDNNPVIAIPMTKPFWSYQYNFLTKELKEAALGHGKFKIIDIESIPENIHASICEASYNYHHNELKRWITLEDSQQWQLNLVWHIWYSRLALAASLFAGVVMGLGTTYLIVESFASIPLLATIPLGLFPGIILPLTLIMGGAYGLLIYNSSTDMLINNPFTKFLNRLRSDNISLKSKFMLALTIGLFILTMLLTYCTIGTWLTIFQQHAPLFALFNALSPYALNHVVPILIGLSVLPFSIQSIANTLDNIEENPGFNYFIESLSTGQLFQNIWAALPKNYDELQNVLWKHIIPGFLGVSATHFEQETPDQRRNPYRIVLRLLYEPLKTLFFTGHIGSVAATGDQVEGIPTWLSFGINGGFELAEDYDYFYHNHVHRKDTASSLKNRFNGDDNHEHDNNIPVRLLNLLFDPLFKATAQWDYDHATPEDKEKLSVQQRYEILQGLKPQNPAPNIPPYRIQSNHKLFLFKSSTSIAIPSVDACCVTKTI